MEKLLRFIDKEVKKILARKDECLKIGNNIGYTLSAGKLHAFDQVRNFLNEDTEKRTSKSVCRNCGELTTSIPMGNMCDECYCEK